MRFNSAKAFYEVRSVNQNCGWHCASLSPSGTEKPPVRPTLDELGGVLGGLDNSYVSRAEIEAQ
ncbi:hypothetical protein XAC3824_1230002 [Xanthomonas citri pv. citri]|nr:hypothetical protein XAC3824_1230002 [Xanthomonas citri pv. citri]CEE51690.1 hypothetical protein XAC71A_1330016 [Xanthomonas citri pv. citri]CEH39460.1 hypothetical protein XACG102_10760003 [Xanthomonas citri pv. citri]CEL35693.1 hypothetical protein XAC4311_2470015 [Xanthomonas citri pv. citri]CEL42877.1 hypothetical protein XAC439_12120002 [Xanthomonas citri pv. citri]